MARKPKPTTAQDVVAGWRALEKENNQVLAYVNTGAGPKRFQEAIGKLNRAQAEYIRVITEWAKTASRK